MIEHGIALQDGQWYLIRGQWPACASKWGWSLRYGSLVVGFVHLPFLGGDWRAVVSGKRDNFTGDAHQCIEWLWNRRHELMPE